jgi:hypothetical protein
VFDNDVIRNSGKSRLTSNDTAFSSTVGNDSSRIDTEQRLTETVIANTTLAISQLAKGTDDFSGDVEIETAGHFSAWKQGEGIGARSQGR